VVSGVPSESGERVFKGQERKLFLITTRSERGPRVDATSAQMLGLGEAVTGFKGSIKAM
jgi:hypothetical protein